MTVDMIVGPRVVYYMDKKHYNRLRTYLIASVNHAGLLQVRALFRLVWSKGQSLSRITVRLAVITNIWDSAGLLGRHMVTVCAPCDF